METNVRPELNLRIRKGPILRYKSEKMEFFDRNLIYGIRNYQEKSYTTVKIEKWNWKNGKVGKWKIRKKLEKSYRQWGRTPLIVTLDLHIAPDFRVLCPYKYTYHIRVPTRLGSYMLFTAKPRVPNLNFLSI